MATMNIPLAYADDRAARGVGRVELIRRLYVNVGGQRLTLALHRPHNDAAGLILADYRSGFRLAQLVGNPSQQVGRPVDYDGMARDWMARMVEQHGAGKVLARFESVDRLN